MMTTIRPEYCYPAECSSAYYLIERDLRGKFVADHGRIGRVVDSEQCISCRASLPGYALIGCPDCQTGCYRPGFGPRDYR